MWQKLTAAKKQSTYFPNLYEKIMVFRKSEMMKLNKIYIKSDKDDDNYPYIEEGTGRRYGTLILLSLVREKHVILVINY